MSCPKLIFWSENDKEDYFQKKLNNNPQLWILDWQHYTEEYKPALKLSLIILLYSILFIYLHTPLFHLPPPHPFSPILMDEKVPSLQKGAL